MGFKDKLRGIQQYASSIPADEVIIFLDGFDSQIVRSPQLALTRWRQLYAEGVTISVHTLFGRRIDAYLNARIFKGSMNSGMFMGRAGDIARLWASTLEHIDECKGDDQCALNIATQHSSMRVHVDINQRIFKNISYAERAAGVRRNDDAIFHSYPGTLSGPRFVRACVDYGRFLWVDVFVIVIIVTMLVRLRRWPPLRCSGKREYGPIECKENNKDTGVIA